MCTTCFTRHVYVHTSVRDLLHCFCRKTYFNFRLKNSKVLSILTGDSLKKFYIAQNIFCKSQFCKSILVCKAPCIMCELQLLMTLRFQNILFPKDIHSIVSKHPSSQLGHSLIMAQSFHWTTVSNIIYIGNSILLYPSISVFILKFFCWYFPPNKIILPLSLDFF